MTSVFRIGIFVLLALCSGCANAFNDQIEVPEAGQRLVVGHDSWPNKQIWVVENGKMEIVTVVPEAKK